jgi:hypothetical protein
MRKPKDNAGEILPDQQQQQTGNEKSDLPLFACADNRADAVQESNKKDKDHDPLPDNDKNKGKHKAKGHSH